MSLSGYKECNFPSNRKSAVLGLAFLFAHANFAPDNSVIAALTLGVSA